MEQDITLFKTACFEYLSTLSLDALRSYGRYMQLRSPTTMKKAEIINDVISVLCGELNTQRNNCGAPVKNSFVDPSILQTIAMLQEKHLPCNLENSSLDTPTTSAVFLRDTEKIETSLQLSICYSSLTLEQKSLLHAFLRSL